MAHSPTETAKLNAVDPYAWFADTIGRLSDHKITKVNDPLPWHWNRQPSDRTLMKRAHW
ncbi:transposase domain-containing protein [Paracoccus sp. (in: a-proteobacteria)]|uniref:transposase domain-containing protein n=1 Tax=Paracoccus sp. TaxID=267 RepID=UPI00396C718C